MESCSFCIVFFLLSGKQNRKKKTIFLLFNSIMAFYTNRSLSINIYIYAMKIVSNNVTKKKTENWIEEKKACADTLTNLTMQTEQCILITRTFNICSNNVIKININKNVSDIWWCSVDVFLSSSSSSLFLTDTNLSTNCMKI